MFLSELSPIIKELIQQPVAFTSGFCSGLLRLNLNEQPLSTWLAKQGLGDFANSNHRQDPQEPQSISIE